METNDILALLRSSPVTSDSLAAMVQAQREHFEKHVLPKVTSKYRGFYITSDSEIYNASGYKQGHCNTGWSCQVAIDEMLSP